MLSSLGALNAKSVFLGWESKVAKCAFLGGPLFGHVGYGTVGSDEATKRRGDEGNERGAGGGVVRHSGSPVDLVIIA